MSPSSRRCHIPHIGNRPEHPQDQRTTPAHPTGGRSLPGPNILWAEFAPNGTLWVGGYRTDENPQGGGWVASWDGARWRQASGVPDGFPQDVAFDRQGRVWVAFDPHGEELAGGLAYHDGSGREDLWAVVEGLQSDRVERLFVDDSDGLWIVYVNDPFAPIDERDRGAVSYLKDGRWTHWTDQDGLPGGDPTDRCSSLAPCRLRDEIERQRIFQTSDGSIVVEMGRICTTGKGSTCVGGGWAEYDGTEWIEINLPEFGIRTDTEQVWKTTSYRGLEPIEETKALVAEPRRFETSAAAPTTTMMMPSTTTPSTTSVPTTTTTAQPTPTTLAPTTTTTPSTGVEELQAGLFCRDLAGIGCGYSDAVAYWMREGSPDRMNADCNGIPCETVYPADDVTGFWGDPLPTTTTTTTDVYYSVATHADQFLWPDALPGSGGWWGSGCSPGSSNTLPDGIWWGYVTGLTQTSVTFDLVCIKFVVQPDDDANTEDYAWVIENNNPRLRTISVSSDAVVSCQWMGCPPDPYPYIAWITDDRLPHGDSGREGGIWLYVNNGVVTEVGDAVFAG